MVKALDATENSERPGAIRFPIDLAGEPIASSAKPARQRPA